MVAALDRGLPILKHVIQSYDTAFSKKETADYSAITTWGIFTPHESGPDAIMLLDAIKGKYDFPELKMVALDQYKYWNPETVIIEAKASGQSLLQEFRRMGIPVMDYTPGRGQDKHSRVNATVLLFSNLAKCIFLETNIGLKKLLKNVQHFLMVNMTIM
jgi:phage terminase large subunit-like protein